MSELFDLFGGSVTTGPPIVPSVQFHMHSSSRRNLRLEGERQCGHCIMNARRWHDEPASIPQWKTAADVITLKAIFFITQVDGSTLFLCAQHAAEHEERGKRDD